jgi:hypothetical protein
MSLLDRVLSVEGESLWPKWHRPRVAVLRRRGRRFLGRHRIHGAGHCGACRLHGHPARRAGQDRLPARRAALPVPACRCSPRQRAAGACAACGAGRERPVAFDCSIVDARPAARRWPPAPSRCFNRIVSMNFCSGVLNERNEQDSRGIGEAIALRLARRLRHRRALPRQPRQGRRGGGAHPRAGPRARVLQFDVADRAACRRGAGGRHRSARRYYGVVCNAGWRATTPSPR